METNRIVLITGGSSGIGAETVKLFADNQDTVYILDKAAPTIHHTENVHYLACDVSDIPMINQIVTNIIQQHQRIDAAVLNAAIPFTANIEETTEEDFDHVIDVNLKGVFFLLKAILPVMKKQDAAAIVLVGSNLTIVGQQRSAVYSASKGAIGQLTKSAAVDYGHFGIRVNCVCPGVINTPLLDQVVKQLMETTGNNRDTVEETFKNMHLLERIGQPNEVAEMIYFLCSDKASFVTGALVSVDGGYTTH